MLRLVAMMYAEFYKSRPASGSIIERRFHAVGDCTWVRFVTDDGIEWAGVFGKSGLERNRDVVTIFSNNRTALVIAGGQGYVIDAQTGECHYKTECDDLCDATTVPERDFVIACGACEVMAISRAAVLWRSPPIATDGITFDLATSQSLTGRAFSYFDGWRSFVLTFDTWQLDPSELILS